MKILFRVDSSKTIGLGHAKRSETLALEMISKNFEVYWISINAEGVYKPNEAIKFKIYSNDDFKEINEFINSKKINIVIFDSYSIDFNYEKNIIAQYKIAIDDIARFHCVDLIIDQNNYSSYSKYKQKNPDSHLLIGPKYSLVAQEFLNSYRRRDKIIDKILVSFGGADPFNNSETIADIAELNQHKHWKILLSESHVSFLRLKEKYSNMPNIEILTLTDRMAQLMNWADFFIGALGSTTWERASCGLPGICFPIVENQLEIFQQLTELGAVINPPENTFESWKITIEKALKDPLRVHLCQIELESICDGKGVERVSKHILELTNV